MNRRTKLTISLGLMLLVGGCAVVPPSAPTVMALPPAGKPFDQFQQEDYTCRVYAQNHTAYPAQGTYPGVASAAVGTALGAAAGAALGAVAGNPGAGAAIGGATGLVGGSAYGANATAATQAGLQQQYDVAYTQCMYAHGDTVQSPPPAYGAVGVPYGYGYGYGYPGYGAGFFGPDIVVGFGGGWGWGGGWGHGWHGGGWHGSGWHH